MNTLTNLSNRIKVIDFNLTKANGIWISYTLDNSQKDLIETDEENICLLLHQVGAIVSWKLRDGLLCVKAQYDEDRYRWFEYDDFLLEYSLSQRDAIEIAANHERSLIGKELTKETNEMLTAIQNM